MDYNEKTRQLLRKQMIDARKKIASANSVSLEAELKATNISENEKLVIMEILKASRHKNRKGHRYSGEWIVLCLIFHMKSPATYRLLRETNVLPLPCTSTIKRYLSVIDTPCGFHQPLFDLLEEKLKSMPEINRHFIVSVDEIKTRKNVRLNTKIMESSGLTDYGDGTAADVSDQADYGLVIMLQPLMDDYTQPIAVFISNGPTNGVMLAKLIIQAIVLLEKVGAKIHGVVSDGASTNKKFWSELGISGKFAQSKSWFPHPTVPDRKVYAFSDPPHLIKCIRNRLYDKQELKVHPDKDPVKWSYFSDLFEVDRSNLNGRLCPKLTHDHIEPNNLLKMRVFLALQIFSFTTASGLLHYKKYAEFKNKLEGCESTVEFCLMINKMFDAMNRLCPEKAVKYKNEDLFALKNALSWLDEWEERINMKKKIKISNEKEETAKLGPDDFLTTSTSEGLRVTLQSMIDLKKTLAQEYNFEYVLTGKINQDPLEVWSNIFRSISS